MAIITNFLLNEFWTFRDKTNQLLESENRFHRFIKFNVICGFGGILNTMTLWGLTELGGLYYLISNLFGVGVSTLWNYFINANVTWTASALLDGPRDLAHPLVPRRLLEQPVRQVDPNSTATLAQTSAKATAWSLKKSINPPEERHKESAET